jgi:hypothetical protein
MDQYVTLASDSVIWENIGGQVLTANLNTGVYCNLESGTACVVWHLLMSGLNTIELTQLMKEHYQTLPASFTNDLNGFIQKLVNAHIWQLANEAHPPEEPISRAISDYHPQREYSQPTFLLYDDINTLLQIDPIDDEIGELIHADAAAE